MIPIYTLALPILLTALAVFVGSFILWAVLPHHQSDYGPLPDEEAARGLLQAVPPGLYNVPNLPSRAAMKDPDYVEKMEEGPLIFMTVVPAGVPKVGKSLVQWAVFVVLVSAAIAYIGTRSLDPGASFLRVFQVLGTVGWLAYGTATVQEAVWYGRPWRMVWKQLADAFVLGLITGAVFGAFWP